ncbi:ABC transporter ATP-binding protein [Chloroflexota bacterium]
MAIIVTEHLTKKFKDLVAVDDVSLEIEEGECFGLLGPNGAGKTSLIRMITAVSPPASGAIRVMGKDLKVYPRQVKAMLGVVPQIDNLDVDLTVIQNLTTFARYFSIPKDEAYRRSLEVIDLFQLDDKRNSRIRELSGGMKRRLLLARGLINRPKILILDEPSIGLDPQARHLVWRKLGELKAQGVTQLLCTQNMEEAAILCDRVTIMHLGKVLTQDSPQALVARYAGDEVLEVEVNSGDRDKIIEKLTGCGLDLVDAGDTIQVFHTSREVLTVKLGDYAERLRQRPATLEDVFFKLTGRTLVE